MIRVKLTKEIFREGGFGNFFRYQIYVSKNEERAHLKKKYKKKIVNSRRAEF